MVGMGDKDRATDYRTIDAKIHNVVMMLTPEERADRATVNEAVRTQITSRGGISSVVIVCIPASRARYLAQMAARPSQPLSGAPLR
jgi:hypothetical protein